TYIHQFSEAKDVLLDICRTEDRETAGRAAMLMWVIWNNRNCSVWNASRESGRCLGAKAHQLWLKWRSVQHSN
ncbi:hypothetical protein A2U01_0039050, partial [Trifolium medium]|nr:hypothetical protein [Trifolium medium]